MIGLPLTFISPLMLLALVLLPVIWWLLRLTPPKPNVELFPPLQILRSLAKKQETPAHSPWWLTLLRLVMAAFVILALAEPIWNPTKATLNTNGSVLIVVDDGWTAGADWDSRRNTALRLIDEAEAASLPVAIVFMSQGEKADPTPGSATEAREKLLAANPLPVVISRKPAIAALTNKFANRSSEIHPASIVWLSNGIHGQDAIELANVLGKRSDLPVQLYLPDHRQLVVIASLDNQPATMIANLQRIETATELSGKLNAYDQKGRSIAEKTFTFPENQNTVQVPFKLPVELRNEITRLQSSLMPTAGSVFLLDDRFKRRRVGLISGENIDAAQPLLSPLYYLNRALEPFSEIRQADSANIAAAAKSLIDEQASVLVLADIGTMGASTVKLIEDWVKNGGLLVRFAGPRLAAAGNHALVPTPLRKGGRSLSGSLTWGTPQPLARFDAASPFAGLVVPDDITVTQQVLAEPVADLGERTWASLADGTPLVTATSLGRGQIVLFHVTADATWSNLALSGSFVDMLRRIVATSTAQAALKNNAGDGAGRIAIYPPLQAISATGQLRPPAEQTQPLKVLPGQVPQPSLDTPPGTYGTSDAYVALNLFASAPDLKPMDPSQFDTKISPQSYQIQEPVKIKPPLLLLALLLLALDCVAVLWMAGAFHRVRKIPGLALVPLAVAIVLQFPDTAQAQETLPAEFAASLQTRLAYVKTGNAEMDRISQLGLSGLTRFIATRTSLEPGEPVGLDIASDELAFYPLIYWPIEPEAALPSPATMARIDAFMKKGGSVLFDTRDQFSGGFGGNGTSAATLRLRQILASLDIPPLEPVPANHVLSKAFYLLDTFPGRYFGGELWVEAGQANNDKNRPVRTGDGVSSILITSNDFAGAWALDAEGRAVLPTIPPDPVQRVLAFRTGVNLVMYTLTGNYKSDQVHIPALLERLGQ